MSTHERTEVEDHSPWRRVVDACRGAVGEARRAAWHLRTGGLPELRQFWARRHVRRALGRPQTLVTSANGALSFRPWVWPSREPRRAVRVAMIADDFTLAAFQYEWQVIEITPEDWPAHLQGGFDLLFVESAWAGNHKAWQYHLTGPTAPRRAVRELVAACRQAGVPTVFWNKEDPTHFEDFLDTAALFDWVFTTDADRVDAYRARLGHDRVGVLPFAVPDLVCNPIRVVQQHQPRGVAFAGTWFAHKYPERREQMRLLFDATLAVNPEDGFDIFSRFLGGEERYQFPEPYDAYVRGSLDYNRMLSAYRAYKVFLNVNTVTTSPTMCARRVLEITACGTPVVSTPAPALRYFLGEGIAQVSDVGAAQETLQRLLTSEHDRAAMVHVGQRRLWQEHTYSHRVDRVLDAVRIDHVPTRLPTVSLLVSTNRPHQLDHVLESAGRQVGCNAEVILATHGFEPPRDLAQRAREAGVQHLTPVYMPATASLGECLNALLELAEGEVVSKMDDDDYYGPHYLQDLLFALRYSDADIVGKHARYVYLAGPDVTVLNQGVNEHRYTTFVAGPTLTATRQVASSLGFSQLPTGEDSDFLRRAVEAGLRIYAADRFNFIQFRSDRASDHTWTPEEDGFARSPVVQRGHAVELVTI